MILNCDSNIGLPVKAQTAECNFAALNAQMGILLATRPILIGQGSGSELFTMKQQDGVPSVIVARKSPSIKLATNTPLYQSMRDDMDINCGDIVDGTMDISQKGQEIFEKILAVASGQKSKSEALGLGDNEFVPWQIGAVM